MKKQGRALLSVREGDKERVVDPAAKLLKQGFELDATHGTAIVLGEAGINPRLVNKVHEGRPHIQDRIKKMASIPTSSTPPQDVRRLKTSS